MCQLDLHSNRLSPKPSKPCCQTQQPTYWSVSCRRAHRRLTRPSGGLLSECQSEAIPPSTPTMGCSPSMRHWWDLPAGLSALCRFQPCPTAPPRSAICSSSSSCSTWVISHTAAVCSRWGFQRSPRAHAGGGCCPQATPPTPCPPLQGSPTAGAPPSSCPPLWGDSPACRACSPGP